MFLYFPGNTLSEGKPNNESVCSCASEVGVTFGVTILLVSLITMVITAIVFYRLRYLIRVLW